MRFVIAGAVLYGVAVIRGETRPLSTLPWKLVAVLTIFCFLLDYGLIYTAETHLDSGLVAVLFGVLPFFAFGFARLLLGERVTWRVVMGSCCAFIGVAVISLTGIPHGSPLYALAVIGAAAAAAYSNVYTKRYGTHSPLLTLPPAMTIAGALALIGGLILEPLNIGRALSAPSIFALFYLAIAGSSIAFFLLLWLLARLPAGVVGMATLVFPVIAVLAGVLFGGEHMNAREFAGCALVVAGMTIALTPQVERPALTRVVS